MKTITFTKVELRALEALLCSNPCSNGCAFEEMQTKRTDCDKCSFTKAVNSIEEKIS